MAQFDIHVNKNGPGKSDAPFLMDLQSEPVYVLETRIVAPLRKETEHFDKMISKIHISIEVENIRYIAFISELAAIPVSMIGDKISNAARKRAEIIAAIDLLFTGF
jgi:toxin CcdB